MSVFSLSFIFLLHILINFASCQKELLSDQTVQTDFKISSIGISLQSENIIADDLREVNFVENAIGICNETQTCSNGGFCLKHSCVCLPGTSGERCEIIDDCVKGTLCTSKRETTCQYSVEKQRAYCMCHVMEWRFDDATKTCQSCLCTPTFSQDLKSFSSCEYKQGQQICTCTEGYSYNPYRQICQRCSCGEGSSWCGFDREGNAICSCKEGYFLHSLYLCKKCDCGNHGMCKLSHTIDGSRFCQCDPGYEEFNKTCIECSCGKYGKCIFNDTGKQIGCECVIGYSEQSGKCEICNCGDNWNCTYVGNEKVCKCQEGFGNINGWCTDINECEIHNPCKKSTRCYNNIGSYVCICDIGYKRNRLSGECDDINECEIPTSCSDPNSECVNTDGSYYCVCSSGYAARGGIDSNTLCEKSQTAVLTTFYLSVFACCLILGFGVIWHQFHLYRKRTNNGTIFLVQ